MRGDPRFRDFGFNEVRKWVADQRIMTYPWLVFTKDKHGFEFRATNITAVRGVALKPGQSRTG
jgi:hypothetical protein